MELIDLHMHTIYSDGQYDVKTVLEKCRDANLSVISITDHDSVGAYNDLANSEIRNIFPGKIVVGTELSFNLDNHLYDVLGYDIDYKKMEQLLKKRMGIEDKKKMQADLLEEWKSVCKKLGIRFSEEVLTNNGTNHEAFNVLYDDISDFEKYPENAKFAEFIAPEHRAAFYKKHFSNPNSQFFVNEARYSPTLEEAISMIHECGGKAFLAHAFAYGLEDPISFINYSIEKGLDGIEQYYSTFTDNDISTVNRITNEHNLYVSGGTDFHGEGVKPGISIGIGKGNMAIPATIIMPWAKCMSKNTSTDKSQVARN